MRNVKLITTFSGLNGRIGIFGGTFDPVHKGHIEIGHIARVTESLDTVVFVPNKRNPLKAGAPIAKDEARLDMLLLAIESEPAFLVSDIELRRDQLSFTVETLAAIRDELPRESSLYFILGSDSLESLPKWRRVEEIFVLATLVTVARRGFGPDRIKELKQELPPDCVEQLRAHFINTPYIDISSSNLRASLPKAPPWPLELQEPVRKYIEEKGLYRN